MAALGPVPFKDVAGEVEDDQTAPIEYADIISPLPSITHLSIHLRLYQGVWLLHRKLPGVISAQRRFAPRQGTAADVLLASPPKCGTTWLKALAFATMGATYPPSRADHPLQRLNLHDCVPVLEFHLSAAHLELEAKLEALPSPRLLHKHMQHSLGPSCLTSSPPAKSSTSAGSPRICWFPSGTLSKASSLQGAAPSPSPTCSRWHARVRTPTAPSGTTSSAIGALANKVRTESSF